MNCRRVYVAYMSVLVRWKPRPEGLQLKTRVQGVVRRVLRLRHNYPHVSYDRMTHMRSAIYYVGNEVIAGAKSCIQCHERLSDAASSGFSIRLSTQPRAVGLNRVELGTNQYEAELSLWHDHGSLHVERNLRSRRDLEYFRPSPFTVFVLAIATA
ncbi:hypothetical protein NM688_g3580 [Phlebia brevispora]|uniref:Uncharacterized protein n=1 Tax=Phlebia brevispora TaxID=194682 RepID=A0ACC1T5J7_9APHY|nr:hypothetical protein NM688_g3580 [Phlebia brevispora]